MIPLRVKWASQCTINIARDPELLDLAARSGCVSLSIGLESVNEDSLDSVRKGFNQPRRFARDLAAIRAKGIQVIGLLMVGLDGDTVDTLALARVPHRQQDLVPQVVHALPVSGHEVLRGHGAGGPHRRARLGPLRLRQSAHSSGADDRRSDDGRVQVRLRRLLFHPRHRPPSVPAPQRQLPRNTRVSGREPEGEPLPALERERLGDI
jgi:hypothetical protein